MKNSERQRLGKSYALGFIPFGAAATLFLASCAIGGWFGPVGEFPAILPVPGSGNHQIPAGIFMGLFAIQWFLCMMMLLLLPKDSSPKQKAVFLLALALACRVLLLAHEPSDDMNRYLWEGRVLAHGISPYQYAPNDPVLGDLAENDHFHAFINHPDMPSAYPPLMSVLFSITGMVFYHPLAIKIVLLFFDMGTMGFLCLLLKHRGLDLRWLILYGFNPVILYAFVGQGHFDVIQCFFLTGAICFFDRKKWGWMFLFAGLSVQVKYVAAVAIPFLLNRENLRYAWLAPAAVILPYGLFLWAFAGETACGMFAGILRFGETFAFNGSIHGLLRFILGGIVPATFVCKILLVVSLTFGLLYFHPALNRRYRNDPVSGCFYVLGAVILLSPTVHFWYVSWIVPFLVLRPTRPWMLLCLTIAGYFAVNGIYHHTGVWRLPVWAYLGQWLPFYTLLMWQGVYFLKQVRSPMDDVSPQTVSVVIPAQNEAQRIAHCIRAVLGDDAVMEVIVVDGGSSDETVPHAREAGARVVRHCPSLEDGGGRGGQICAGIDAAGGDLVAVVHADTIVERPIFTTMCRVLEKQPGLVGGAAGSVFESSCPTLGLINVANDFRMVFLGISFGDQVQFFRRCPVVSARLFPNIPLMEDVEFGVRLYGLGPQVFLFGNVRVSPRRWETRGLSNSISVVGRVATYLLQRLRGTPDTKTMYRRYYAKPEDL